MPILSHPTHVLMSAYYRSPEGFLRQLDSYQEPFEKDVEDLRTEVITVLQENMEKFIAPVLVLIKGGKP